MRSILKGSGLHCVEYQKLPVVVIVFNNSGVYGSDRRSPEEIIGPFKEDPAPTLFSLVQLMISLLKLLGAKVIFFGTPDGLKFALTKSFAAQKLVGINVTIDPYCGADSGILHRGN
ncbi:2-hydroxyacyl-CoA lyase-like isoform X2 [Rhododendron vialii]|uniref:2-hydroxyacyl-CoA lyase-like isoform X2 n=1 Tax=Rhododendron vialii TaxID=182163 RepID=UPI00265F8348|nr:2-hydroxyacyl-CoA lyase-like isoform X2 [Rhododendron vialii]